MPDVNWVRRISGALRRLTNEFRENELAYLALTSKVEKQVIDRLAFSLHRDNRRSDCVAIAREYTVPGVVRRVDLAVVERGVPHVPHVFLEAKAMQSFNVNLPHNPPRYLQRIDEDVEKLRNCNIRACASAPQKIILLLITHTSRAPHERWDRVIKYASRIRNYRPRSIARLTSQLDEQMPAERFPFMASGSIRGGRAFDVGVTVHYRLFGPY